MNKEPKLVHTAELMDGLSKGPPTGKRKTFHNWLVNGAVLLPRFYEGDGK
jgi:hypothetical protein